MADKKQVELTIELTDKKKEENTTTTTQKEDDDDQEESEYEEEEEKFAPMDIKQNIIKSDTLFSDVDEEEQNDEDDDEDQDIDQELDEKESEPPPNKGIEFDNKSPPIYVLFGTANISICNDIISCESSIDKLTTIKTNIDAPNSNTYYFEIDIKTAAEIGIGFVDDEYGQDETGNLGFLTRASTGRKFSIYRMDDSDREKQHSWTVNVDALSTDRNGNGNGNDDDVKQQSKHRIIGVGVDINNNECIYYLNGKQFNDSNDMPFDRRLYFTILLPPQQIVHFIVKAENMKYYNNIKDKYDILRIPNEYFEYKIPDINMVKYEEKTDDNIIINKKEEEYPFHVMTGEIAFSCREDYGLLCRGVGDSNTFSSHFKIPNNCQTFYYEIKLENIINNEDNIYKNEIGLAHFVNGNIQNVWTYMRENGSDYLLYNNKKIICDNELYDDIENKQEEEKDDIKDEENKEEDKIEDEDDNMYWKNGDIICCAVDMIEMMIIYWLNGKIVLKMCNKQIMENELIPMFNISKNTRITVCFDKGCMNYLNEFNYRTFDIVMNKFKAITIDPKLDVVDMAYPIKIAKGKGSINRDGNDFICSSRFRSTILIGNFNIIVDQDSVDTVYYEIVLQSKGKIKVGWIDLSDEDYKKNKIKTESIFGYDGDQLTYQTSNKENNSYGDKKWKIGDVIGIEINFQTKIIKYYQNGVDLSVAENNFEIKNNLYLAIYIPDKEKLRVILDKSNMRYINLFKSRPINAIKNYYSDSMNNVMYEIDRSEKDVIKAIRGEIVQTRKNNKIVIMAKSQSFCSTNFKISDTSYKYYYECKLLTNYAGSFYIGWIDTNKEESYSLGNSHVWVWSPMHRLIYHKFEDNRTSKQWPKKVPKPVEIQEYASKIKAKRRQNDDIKIDGDIFMLTDDDDDEARESGSDVDDFAAAENKLNGKRWRFGKGDIIGIGIDFKTQSMKYYLNGYPFGMAFDNFDRDAEGLIRPSFQLGTNERIELRFDKDSMSFFPCNESYLPINVMQTYYALKSETTQSWIKELEDEIYEARTALHLNVKQMNLNPNVLIDGNMFYNLFLEFGEEQKDNTANQVVNNEENTISYKEHYVFEDVKFITSIKDSKYPKITLKKTYNDSNKNGEIVGICDIKDKQFPLSINRKKEIALFIIDDDQTDDEDDDEHDKKEEKKEELKKEDIEIEYMELIKCVLYKGDFRVNMKYDITCEGVSGQWGSFRVNINLKAKGCYYYEARVGNGSLLIGWIKSQYKPKRKDNFLCGLDQGNSWAYYTSGATYHNRKHEQFGKRAKKGDIIGCVIDFDKKCINYYINGKSMGTAFEDIELELDKNESLQPCLGCTNDTDIILRSDNMKYFDKLPSDVKEKCKSINIDKEYFIQKTSLLKGEVFLDAEYKKLGHLIGKCNKNHSLTKYTYDDLVGNNKNINKISKQCTKCFYEPKLSKAKNKMFASFKDKIEKIKDKNEYKDHFIFSCERCNYYLCSNCYVNDRISWLMISERLKSKDTFEKKLLWNNIASAVGKDNFYSGAQNDDIEKFYYHLIQEIRLELKHELGYILSWDAIYQVLNIKKAKKKYTSMNAKYFVQNVVKYFSELHTYCGDPTNQLKDYVLDPNGYKMKLKLFKMENKKMNYCFVCHDFRRAHYNEMTKTKKQRKFWYSTKNEQIMLCYAHGCTFGDGNGGAIQQSKKWINTAYKLAILFINLRKEITKFYKNEDNNNSRGIIKKLLDYSISFKTQREQKRFLKCIEKLSTYMHVKDNEKARLQKILRNHLDYGMDTFLISSVPNSCTLRDFFLKYSTKVMENYYWTFVSKDKVLDDDEQFFEVSFDDLLKSNYNIDLCLNKTLWSSFGDYLRNAPKDFQGLIAKSQEKPINSHNLKLDKERIIALLTSFLEHYIRYDKWYWNRDMTLKNKKYIDREMEQIVSYLIEDQKKDDSYDLNFDSFLNDENWCNFFVTYQHRINSSNKSGTTGTTYKNIMAIKQETGNSVATVPETDQLLVSNTQEEKYGDFGGDDLTHFSLFTTSKDVSKQFYYFMFPRESNDIKFRISTTTANGTNTIITFKFLFTSDMTEDSNVLYEIDEEKSFNMNNKNEKWYILEYKNDEDLILNSDGYVYRSEKKPIWIGISISVDSLDSDDHEHFVISSTKFDANIIESWKKIQDLVAADMELAKTELVGSRHSIIDKFEKIKILQNFTMDSIKKSEMQRSASQADVQDNQVFFVDKFKAKRGSWLNAFKEHIRDLFEEKEFDINDDSDNDEEDDDDDEENDDISVRWVGASRYPECNQALEIRLKGLKYKLPAFVLQEALKIDYSMLTILGPDFIVKEQTLFQKIKIHQKVYDYLIRLSQRDFDHEDKKKQKTREPALNFYNIIKYRRAFDGDEKYIYLTHREDENDNKKEQEEEEEEYHTGDTPIGRDETEEEEYELVPKKLDDPEIFIKKYSLSFAEIAGVNRSLRIFLSDNIQSFESSEASDTNFILSEAEDTRIALYEAAIWPLIELECKREDTIIIESNLTNEGNLTLQCKFSGDCAVLSKQALPILSYNRFFYYEMIIRDIGLDITPSLSCGFALSAELETITSTAIPGKHPNTFGIEGDKGQLLISNKENISYLQIPFGDDQTVGSKISLNTRRSYINYNFMHSESSGSSLKQYPENPATLLPIDISHEMHAFLSLGSRGILIECNFGPNFKDMSARRSVLGQFGFPTGKDWKTTQSDDAERNHLIGTLLKDIIDDNKDKGKEEKEKITRMQSSFSQIMDTDFKRLTEVLLRLQIANEQFSKKEESFLTDLKNEKDEEITAYSIFLSCILHYLMFLTPLNNTTKEQWKQMNYYMGLNKCGTLGFKFAKDKSLEKILLFCVNKLRRKGNTQLFKIINEYGAELCKIDANIDEMGIRLKEVSNFSSEDVPKPFIYLGKLALTSSICQSYFLSLWKMVSRDRLLNASETSTEALKQEFLLDFIACFLSKQNILQIIKELILKWSSASQLIERNTSSFDYSYELETMASGFVRNCRNPISAAVQTAIYLKNYSEVFPDIELDIKKSSVYCENIALQILSNIQSNRLRIIALEANDTLEIALDNNLEIFISSVDVQYLKQITWIQPTNRVLLNAIETETFRDIKSEISQWIETFFYDYFHMFDSFNTMSQFLFTTKSTKGWFFSPIGKVQFESIVTTMHMALIIYMATVIQTVFISTEMSNLEIVFHIANANFFLSEINQILENERYFKETTNYFDLVAIVGYLGIFIMRLLVCISVLSCTTDCIDTNYNALYLFIWIITIGSMCFRFCWMLFAFATMGLLVSSMISMVADIVNFIIFVVIFVVGFATIFTMGTDIDQEGFNSWDSSFLSMVYGMLDFLDNSEFSGVYKNRYRDIILNVLVLLYVLLAVIILLNFIIAVMSTTYEEVTEKSEVFVNFHRMKICFANYDLPTLPAPFQAIPVLFRILFRFFIEPLIYRFTKKYVNVSYFKSYDGAVNNYENFLMIPASKSINSFKKKGFIEKTTIVSYEMKFGTLNLNKLKLEKWENNFWICMYCYHTNTESELDIEEDVFDYYEYNNKQRPDFSFRDEDLKFIQYMGIDLCNNCFRPRRRCSRNDCWESIFAFYMYHLFSFIIFRLPIAIISFIFIAIAYIFSCGNRKLKNWFSNNNSSSSYNPNDNMFGYQIQLKNPYKLLYPKIKPKEFVQEFKIICKKLKGLKTLSKNEKLLNNILLQLTNRFEKKSNESISLLQHIEWDIANEFINQLRIYTKKEVNYYAECVIESSRHVVPFIDQKQNDAEKIMLDFAVENVKTRYTFTNSRVLDKLQES